MCKINPLSLKKIESKQRLIIEQKLPLAPPAVNVASLFGEEPFLSLNGTPLFTPAAVNLETEAFPFPSQAAVSIIQPGTAIHFNHETIEDDNPNVATRDLMVPYTAAALLNPLLTGVDHDGDGEENDEGSFEFKFIPEQYEETPDPFDESEYSETASSNANSPTSGSDTEHVIKVPPATSIPDRRYSTRQSSHPNLSANTSSTSSSSSSTPSLYYQRRRSSVPVTTRSASSPSPSPASSPAIYSGGGLPPTPGNSYPPEVKQTKKKTLFNPQISDEKRERNRLAAEKYRKKGREQIVALERKCDELTLENTSLAQRNQCLEDELARLREILMKNGNSS